MDMYKDETEDFCITIWGPFANTNKINLTVER